MAKAKLRLVAPTTVNRTVAPRRPKNADLRTREHLTDAEVEKLIAAVKAATATATGMRSWSFSTYRHGLRAAEVVDLRWEQVDFKTASLHVRRVKNGTPSTHPLTGRELRELRRHQRESAKSPFVFVSERGAPLLGAGLRAHDRARGRSRPSSASRRTPTCCATPAATSSRMTASIRGRCRLTWGIATSRIRRATRRWRRIGLRAFGGTRGTNAADSTRERWELDSRLRGYDRHKAPVC